jgi:hypothetical protein
MGYATTHRHLRYDLGMPHERLPNHDSTLHPVRSFLASGIQGRLGNHGLAGDASRASIYKRWRLEGRASHAFDSGHFDDCRKAYEALGIRGLGPADLYHYAISLRKCGEVDPALQVLKQLDAAGNIRSYNHTLYQLQIAITLAKKGQTTEARQIVAQTDPSAVRYNLGKNEFWGLESLTNLS